MSIFVDYGMGYSSKFNKEILRCVNCIFQYASFNVQYSTFNMQLSAFNRHHLIFSLQHSNFNINNSTKEYESCISKDAY